MQQLHYKVDQLLKKSLLELTQYIMNSYHNLRKLGREKFRIIVYLSF